MSSPEYSLNYFVVTAVIDSFPVSSNNQQLTAEDFVRFSDSFADILRRRLPVTAKVDFVQYPYQFREIFTEEDKIVDLETEFSRLVNSDHPCCIHPACVMVPFIARDGIKIIGVVTGADHVFFSKVREDWLLEVKESVQLEFLVLKQARVDVPTGLLNLANLYSLLETHGTRSGLQLILLELPSKRSSFHHGVRYSQRCAAILQTFIREGSVLHYLGHCTFALIVLHDGNKDVDTEIEGALVTFLKREGCHRVHVGSSFVRNWQGANSQAGDKNLLDEAWTALKQAKKRGPFSFCSYGSLAYPEDSPLGPVDRNLVRRLHRFWADSEAFCLVHFRSDNGVCSARRAIGTNIDRGEMVDAGEDVLVYLEGEKPGDAMRWAEKVIAGAKQPDRNIHLSAGVSCFPFNDFEKSEMVLNCRKALLHASFYGYSSVAVFDAVSLNISGDVYFADGDLTKAVKEYKRGLRCDGQDINLHNSLGVALAQMNKLPAAMRSFEKALTIDQGNFMALYNLGLTEQARDRKVEALGHFEQALAQCRDSYVDEVQVNDLKLQIGKLSCDVGMYDQAIDYLVPWSKTSRNPQANGRVAYYLGKAYHGINDNRAAMNCLQQALRSNEFDDRAMNLLGRIYLEEGEGDEIALALVQKSVELEPSSVRYRLYLATVLMQCGLYDRAKENLYRCLRYKASKIEARLLLAKTYMKEGLHRRAASWFEKVIADTSAEKKLQVEAARGLADIHTREEEGDHA